MSNTILIPPLGEERSSPLVTCLMLTRNRRRWLPRAIQCFESQDYANRKLLILADGLSVDDLVPKDDPRIRLVALEDVLNIGTKRNIGSQLASGDIIASFDDDDYSAPNRISDQVALLLETGKQVTGYHTMKFTDGCRWWLYQGHGNFALGTSLCYKRTWAMAHPFIERQLSEDNAFVSEAMMEHVFISRPASGLNPRARIEPGDLMYATIHNGNSSPRVIRQNSNWIPLN